MGVVGGGDGGAFRKDLGKAALTKERAVVWETCTRLASTTARMFFQLLHPLGIRDV